MAYVALPTWPDLHGPFSVKRIEAHRSRQDIYFRSAYPVKGVLDKYFLVKNAFI